MFWVQEHKYSHRSIHQSSIDRGPIAPIQIFIQQINIASLTLKRLVSISNTVSFKCMICILLQRQFIRFNTIFLDIET